MSMEFDFNINEVFPETITLISHDSIFTKKHKHKADIHQKLQYIIDILGKRSAKAQQLNASITSLHKSQLSGHHIYVLKDPSSNNGLGTVIGFIKVGKKQLFVFDRDGNHNEMLPLCVLDFYVHESQQRKGCGLCLFKHMLAEENVQPQHIAIDRPSHKFISFLKKHFKLWASIPQVNNFVVFEGFFKSRPDVCKSQNRRRNGLHSVHSRPLSRAVSDDTIKRTRKMECTTFANVLKGIRPASGTEFESDETYSFSHTRNARRKKWNPDGTLFSENYGSAPPRNPFSRYAHDRENGIGGLPPLPPSRRRKNEKDEIITNPYRRDWSQSANYRSRAHDAKPAAPTRDSGSVDWLADLKRKDREWLNGDNHSEIEMHEYLPSSVKTRNAMPASATTEEPAKQHRSQDSVEKQSAALIAENGHNGNGYNMIADLKSKDEQQLSGLPSNGTVQHRNNWQWRQRHHRGGGSSWNVLGVPTRSFWNNF